MKIKLIGMVAGLIAAGATVSQATTLVFDDPNAFSDHFRVPHGNYNYSAAAGGVQVANTLTNLAMLGNAGFSVPPYLNETLSLTFSQQTFHTGPSLGFVTRVNTNFTNYTQYTGVVGLVNINSSGSVKLRIGHGTVYSGMSFSTYDQTFTGLSLTEGERYVLSMEQRNVDLGGDLQAQFRLTLSNEDSSVVFADSLWRSVTGYTSAGEVGLRIFPGMGTAGAGSYTLYDFAPIPEPSTYALLLTAGAVGLILRRNRARHSRIL